MSLAQHSKESPSWGTPPEIVEMARCVLGSIDYDPCSEPGWNETVRATRYWTEQDNSLDPRHQWPVGNYFINPPGGLIKEFWKLAESRYIDGCSVFWVGFSLEQLLYLQAEGYHGAMSCQFMRCIPRKRIAFVDRRTGMKSKAPTHGNYLLLMGTPEQEGRFRVKAGDIGAAAW